MGNRNSVESTVEKFVSSATSIYTSTGQDCAQYTEQKQVINVGGEGDVVVEDTKFKQMATIDAACLQKAANSAEADQKIADLIKNTSESIDTALSAKAGDSNDVKSRTKLLTQIASSIRNEVNQKCTSRIIQEQEINIGGAGKVKVKGTTFEQFASSVAKCVQESIQNSKDYKDLKQELEQSSKSTVKGILDFLNGYIGLVAIAAVIFFLFVGKTTDTVTKPKVFMPAIAIVMFILSISFFWKGFPYGKIKSKTGQIALFVVFLAATVVSGIVAKKAMDASKGIQ